MGRTAEVSEAPVEAGKENWVWWCGDGTGSEACHLHLQIP